MDLDTLVGIEFVKLVNRLKENQSKQKKRNQIWPCWAPTSNAKNNF